MNQGPMGVLIDESPDTVPLSMHCPSYSFLIFKKECSRKFSNGIS
jgi:hypothetical protein